MRFDSYHPFINLLFFFSVIAFSIAFVHPVYVGISLFCALAYSIRLHHLRGLGFGLIALLVGALFAYWYALYHHFGVTVLGKNSVGNSVTWEVLLYSILLGLRIASILLWMSCVHTIFSADKVVYLFGRINPKLSLFLTIILRMIPRLKAQARKIYRAQRSIGRGLNTKNPLRWIINALRLLSILITWFIDSLITSSESMKSRGYTLKGRTAFSLYRFDNRDRGVVITCFFCLTLSMMAILFGQTSAAYNPHIVINPITSISYIFYAAYAFFCLFPLLLQSWGEIRFQRQQKRVVDLPRLSL